MDECRIAFENWYVNKPFYTNLALDEYNMYTSYATNLAWSAWHAAWEKRGLP